MAGQGARFGHKFKPFLTIGDETFIEAAVKPFRRFAGQISRFVFVYLKAQETEFAVSGRLGTSFTGLPIVTVHLETPTRGPAETIGRAVEQLGATGPAFVCDCDHALDVEPLFEAVAKSDRWDVLLPVWPLDEENLASWSVAMVDGDRVLAISEKKLPELRRGTPMGVIGCYGFRDIANIAARAEAMGATNFSDVINQLLGEGAIVKAARIERAVFFGDPERLEKAAARRE
jgi:NDP-sugar pyrophosphorylase family protein